MSAITFNLDLTKRIQSQRPLTPMEVDQNWTDIENAFASIVQQINTELDIFNSRQVAFEERLDNNFPPGTYDFTALDTPRDDWLKCDGTLYDPADYPDLFAVIGTTFGGDGVSTFAVPDFTDIVPIGGGAFVAFGQEGGGTIINVSHAHGVNGSTEDHTLTAAQSGLKPHAHGIPTDVGGATTIEIIRANSASSQHSDIETEEVSGENADDPHSHGINLNTSSANLNVDIRQLSIGVCVWIKT